MIEMTQEDGPKHVGGSHQQPCSLSAALCLLPGLSAQVCVVVSDVLPVPSLLRACCHPQVVEKVVSSLGGASRCSINKDKISSLVDKYVKLEGARKA